MIVCKIGKISLAMNLVVSGALVELIGWQTESVRVSVNSVIQRFIFKLVLRLLYYTYLFLLTFVSLLPTLIEIRLTTIFVH